MHFKYINLRISILTAITVIIPTSVLAEKWDINAFPISNQVWLASYTSDIILDQQLSIYPTETGEIWWLVNDGEHVTKDQIIGYSDNQKISLSKRSWKNKIANFNNDLLDLEKSTSQAETSLIEEKKKLLLSLSKYELTPTEYKILGADFAKRLKKEKLKIEKEIQLIEERLNSDYFKQSLTNDKDSLQLDLDNAEYTHEQLLRSLELRAPQSGTLQIHLNKADQSQKAIASVIQKNISEITIPLLDNHLKNTEHNSLIVQFQSSGGNIYKGNFKEVINKLASNQIKQAQLVFTIDLNEENKETKANIEGRRLVSIYKKLEPNCYIVPKKSLLFDNSDQILKLGWAKYINSVADNVEVVFIGPRELALKIKK